MISPKSLLFFGFNQNVTNMKQRILLFSKLLSREGQKKSFPGKSILFLSLILIGLQGFAQYTQVTNSSGTTAYGSVSVTTTSSGSVSYAGTCTSANFFWLNPGSSYTFTFSSPVSALQMQYMNGPAVNTLTTGHFIVNGSPYTITGANISAGASICSDFTLNVISGGNLTNAGDLTGTPNSQVDIPGPITSITIQHTGGSNLIVFQMAFNPIPVCPPGSPHPAIIAMSGGGGYCSGGSGVNVGLVGSAVGINYQLYLAGSPVGSPVAGIGAALSFGLQTTAGTYTATATNAITGCVSNMSGSETVTIYPLPNVYTVTGGGSYCTGGTGVAVGMSSTDLGVNYKLYRGGLPVAGMIVPGTGGPISFGLQTLAGVYTVVAQMGGFTTCTNNMTGSVTISINPLPTAYTITGGGTFCFGGTGVHVGLSNSTIGVNYQLFLGGTATGSPVAGTGSPLDFGLKMAPGTYTCVATNATTSCVQNMIGSATVGINPLPMVFGVTGGGGYCAGGSGAAVGLSASTYGINYQLYFAGSPLGSPVGGTGAALSFGLQTGLGIYTVVGTNATTGCVNNMSGSVTVTINPLPNVYSVTGGGLFCAGGGGGIAVGLSSSDVGVLYQLYRGTTTIVGGPAGGTGGAISFGLQTIGGTYTVFAYNPATGCSSNMTGSATVTVSSLPAAIPMTGGGGYCVGSPGVHIGLAASATGVLYQLFLGGSPVGSAVTGTGAAIDFGYQTTTGIYTATATDPATGCASNMIGSETVYIYSLPVVYTVTGGGSYCAGGSGVIVGLSGSDLLVNYQLYLGGSPVVGALVAGTGSAISFGLRTAAGVYTVVATNGTITGCVSNMAGSVTVAINPLPAQYTVTGGGSYCSGSTGVHVGLAGSAVGVNYQLYRGTVAVGSAMAGTGSALDFGLQTTSGTYSVVATNATTACVSNMTGTVSVSINSLPVALTVTGGGGYCVGGTGALVGLAGSVYGISYQLFNGGSPAGSPLSGTGAGLSFGLQTTPGTYTVVATNTTTGCTNTMAGSATVYINPLPTVYTMTGSGGYCAGGTGLHVGLSGSNTGVLYQLYRGTSGVGSPMAGTGSALDFGVFTTAGAYTVIATTSGSLCVNNMSGTTTISINPLPTAFTVTGGGAYCTGGTGVSVSLAGSQSGVNYQLYRSSTATGSPVAGTGTGITFGLQTTAGTYSVLATDATTGCVSTMTGTVSVSVISTPAAYTVTGGGGYCAGGTGMPVYLSGSQVGVNYQLFNGGSAVGIPVAGTGAAISYGLFTTAGTYTVVGTSAAGGCTNNMTGSVTIIVNPLPNAYTITGGGSYCSGGSGIAIGLTTSDAGINYQLYRGTTAVGSLVSGTGTVISFGSQTTAGTYSVIAINPTTGCTRTMSGTVTISVTSAPAIVTVTGGGGYCSGGSGVHVGLNASAVGVSYQLYRGGSAVGSPVAGAGSALDFGLQTTAGTYTATASNGCISTMSGSATVYVYALPTVYTVTGGGSYCAGTWGVHVGLSGSNSGISYKLYLSGTPVGSAVSGTGSPLDFGLFTGAGTYTVVATASGTGCTVNMTGSATIAVNPNPTVTGSIYTVAPGASITLTGSIGGGTWSSSSTAIASVGATTGIVNGVSLGTVIIYYTLTTGCLGSQTVMEIGRAHV